MLMKAAKHEILWEVKTERRVKWRSWASLAATSQQ